MTIHFNPSILAERYWDEGLTERVLAKEYKVSPTTIHRRLVEYGIPRRPQGGVNFIRGRDGWAKNYDQCNGCGTDKKPHKAFGLCVSCYDKVRHPRITSKGRGVYAPRQKEEKIDKQVVVILETYLIYTCAKCGYQHYDSRRKIERDANRKYHHKSPDTE